MALNAELKKHMDAIIVASGYTVTGTSATISASLDHRQLQELIDKAATVKHDVKVASGTLTVAPRRDT